MYLVGKTFVHEKNFKKAIKIPGISETITNLSPAMNYVWILSPVWPEHNHVFIIFNSLTFNKDYKQSSFHEQQQSLIIYHIDNLYICQLAQVNNLSFACLMQDWKCETFF